MSTAELRQRIFSVNDETFEAVALDVFRHQAARVSEYKAYLQLLGRDPKDVQRLGDIPFLPVELFKTKAIIEDGCSPEITFSSSGTTGMVSSRHLVADKAMYEESFRRAFEIFYGNIEDYCLIALLPSYLERNGSSLIYMADDLLQRSKHPDSKFHLYDPEQLTGILRRLHDQKQKTMLLGVTYALLDLAEQFPQPLPDLIIMETGGMKGRRKEMVREEVHEILQRAFSVQHIHSEYGMTELLSQAYSKGEGIFSCPPWMRVLVRDASDPFSYVPNGRTGGLNIIDLANLHSCSFIAVSDLGRVQENGSFEVLGRFDHSDIRGCNLLVQ